ncbi:tyrosine-type recombinase/integrase [Ferroplasma acidiphilum]|nr:site-specific integrase [Ferroplasma acidiphilum]
MVNYTDFEDWMYERFSKSTIIDTLRKIRYRGKHLDLSSRESMLEFLRKERRNGSPKQKVNGYIKYLNRLLTFEGLDKIDYIPELRNNSFRKRAFATDQIQTLIVKSKGKTIEDKRNHAMILLALNTGLRRSEICNIKVEDRHNNFLTVNYGKGEKSRDVFLDDNTRKVIMDYSFIRNNNDMPYLFTTKKGKVTPGY